MPDHRAEARRRNLGRLLNPSSIAVVGASAAEEKAGFQALKSLDGFGGRIIPINPGAREIRGLRAYPNLEAVGAPVDLAIIVVPADAGVAAFAEAARCDCAGAMIVSGGFAESGPEGGRRQAALAGVIAGSAIRLLGPNTSGFVNLRAALRASFAPGLDCIRPGNVAVIAQSGGVNLTLAFLAHARGVGLSFAVGLGNAVDVDAADVLEYLLEDASTRAIALHLEGLGDGRRLFDVLRRVTPRKPVVALVAGRSDVATFAQSHTGRLLGSHARKTAMLRQAGAVVVETTADAADAVATFSRVRLSARPRPGVGIVTGQAGPGLLIADQLQQAGVAIPRLAEPTLTRIRELLPPMTYLENPVDTGRPSPTFPEVVKAVLGDDAVDLVAVFALHEPAALDPAGALLPALGRKPIVFATACDEALVHPTIERLEAAGIPCARSPEQLARAAQVLVADAHAQDRLAHSRPEPARPRPAVHGTLDEAQAKALLESYGIRTPKSAVCASRDAAARALRSLGGAVVVKLLSAEVLHKSDVGGVVVGVSDEASLAAALDQIDRVTTREAKRYLIEAMAPDGVELIVGGTCDPVFGPVVMLGLGGVAAEALRDTASRLAPVEPADVLEMIAELRGRVLLEGFRGLPPADPDAIAATVQAVGRLLVEHPEITEVEINPLRVTAGGCVALDALVVSGSAAKRKLQQA